MKVRGGPSYLDRMVHPFSRAVTSQCSLMARHPLRASGKQGYDVSHLSEFPGPPLLKKLGVLGMFGQLIESRWPDMLCLDI